MFSNFYIRTSYEEFIDDYAFFLDINELAAILKKFKCNTIHAPFYDISPGGFNQEIRRISLEKLQRVQSIANTCKSKLMVMHFNFDPIYYKEFFKRWLKNASLFFKELAKEKSNLLLALENISEPTPYISLKLMEEIDSSRVVPCFDIGHHHVFGQISFHEWLFYLKSKGFIHFHFHDNFADQDNHLALGKGDIRWKKLKEEILELDIDFSVTLELHSRKEMLKSLKYYRETFL